MSAGTFVEPSHILTLALPVGRIKRRQYELYLSRLQAASEVRLLDVSLDESQDQTAALNPQTFPNGKITYSICPELPSPPLDSLYDLEPWRQPFLVIGVAQYKESECKSLTGHLNSLKEKYSPNSLCRLLVFGVPEDSTLKRQREIIPIVSSNFTSLESAMADLASHVLGQLNALLICKDLESLKSAGAHIREAQLENKLKAENPKQSSEKGNSQSTVSASKSDLAREIHKSRLQRNSSTRSIGLVSKSGSISIGQTERAKYSQKGRSMKFKASLFLMGGQLPEAYTHFVEAAQLARSTNDYLWLGSAIEGLAICFVLQAFNEMPLSMPSVMNSLLKDYDYPPVKDLVAPMLRELLPKLAKIVLKCWEKCPADGDETAPIMTYYGFILRFVRVLISMRKGGGWSVASLHSIVRGADIQSTITPESPSIQKIHFWCKYVLDLSSKDIPPAQLQKLYNDLCQVYARLGLLRKWSLVIRNLLDLFGLDDTLNISTQTLDQLLLLSKACYKSPEMRKLCLWKFLGIAESREEASMIVNIASELLSECHMNLAASDQHQLYNLIQSQDVQCPEFWDRTAFQSVSLLTNFVPISSKPIKSTSAETGFYNPFKATADLQELVVIQGVQAQLEVTLQNSYEFKTYYEYVYLMDSSGKKIGDMLTNICVTGLSTQRFCLSFVPDRPGTVNIQKCCMRALKCPDVTFDINASGQLENSSPSSHNNSKAPTGLSLTVLPARPSLTLKRNSLQKGRAMLLEGEVRMIKLEISNMSPVQCDLIQFGFTDSTTEQLKEALAKPGTMKADLYELEYFIYQRRAIKLLSSKKSIGVYGSDTFDFELMGKRGVTSVTILVDYGASVSSLHRLRVPVPITVFPSIELERVDILGTGDLSTGSTFKVTLVIDLHNSWRQELEVTLWSGKLDHIESDSTVKMSVFPNTTQRFLLPVNIPVTTDEELSMPIPSLTEKQFVVDNKTTKEALQSFWIREKLLELLNGFWRTKSDLEEPAKEGKIEFRGIQLTKRMLSILKNSSVTISLHHEGSTQIDEPTEIMARLENRSKSTRSGMIRFYVEDDAHVLYQRNLQQPVTIPPESHVDIKQQIIPLAKGEHNWSVLFDIIEGGVAYSYRPLTLTVV